MVVVVSPCVMEEGGCKAAFTAVQSGQGIHMTNGLNMLIRLRVHSIYHGIIWTSLQLFDMRKLIEHQDTCACEL